ncbi:rod shape-determining protein MreD [Paraferrimonas sedimenticola]|uniref:Rod shape-determining protein MreD n=1 Tax=Paraferrimonas sedimenticola TaxID=375674 RepID=A0AA37RX87_9GAMM|nr:rod shape-determining protein MreD [Paraferrimonas sedimenticola]GLP97370.1 rod shape-determining protein MreD [Paraferrimonas sedimenticola]
MALQAANGRAVVWATLFLALLLQIMPLPEVVSAARPDWLFIALAYWTMALPHRYSILTAWLMGLLLDILLGATMGVRALALALVIYVVALHFQRLRNFPVWQQAILLAVLSGVYHLVIFWIQFVTSKSLFDPIILLPVVSNLIIWSWAYWLLRRIRRDFKVR